MDSIKLNLRTPLYSIGEIFFSSATINLDENISILFNKKDDMFDLSKGETLVLKRYVYNKDGVNFITKLVDIIDMDIDNKTMVLSQPVNDLIPIKNIYSANTIGEDFSIIELESPHHIFLQDINFQKIIFYDSGREIVEALWDRNIPFNSVWVYNKSSKIFEEVSHTMIRTAVV